MTSSRPDPGAAVLTAMVCAGAVSEQFIMKRERVPSTEAFFLSALAGCELERVLRLS